MNDFCKQLQSLVLSLGGSFYKYNVPFLAPSPKIIIDFPRYTEKEFKLFADINKQNRFFYQEDWDFERLITSIEYSHKEEAVCIRVDAPDQLFLIDDFIVTHNTATVLAAGTIMRNRGKFIDGKQVTLITSPTKNTHVWHSEIAKFRGEDAVLISGSREERIKLWEGLLDKAKTNSLPVFVVCSLSKFRNNRRPTEEESTQARVGLSEEELEELDEKESAEAMAIDSKYMQLMAQGGTSNDKQVSGGHIAAMVLDESAHFINPQSNRTKVALQVADSVYHGKGLVWTLNGDISSNTASDTISEMALVNKMARDNFAELESKFTIVDRNSTTNRRKWYNLTGFFNLFRENIHTLNSKVVAGDKYGLRRLGEKSIPMGQDWANIYWRGVHKIKDAMEAEQTTRAVGVLSILISSQYGAADPRRLLEYGLADDEIERDLYTRKQRGNITQEQYDTFHQEIGKFIRSSTDYSGFGRLPHSKEKISIRNERFNQYVSKDTSKILDEIIDEWNNPFLDDMTATLTHEINTRSAEKLNPKIGVSGFSKRAMNKLYQRMLNKYGSTVQINIIDGDTPASSVAELQKKHQEEQDRPVISFVTGAGAYGLSLPSDAAYNSPSWNAAKAGQFAARFHRHPKQPCDLTTMLPTGISEYQVDLSREKEKIGNTALAELARFEDDDVDVDSDKVVSPGLLKNLLDKFFYYAPEVR